MTVLVVGTCLGTTDPTAKPVSRFFIRRVNEAALETARHQHAIGVANDASGNFARLLGFLPAQSLEAEYASVALGPGKKVGAVDR